MGLGLFFCYNLEKIRKENYTMPTITQDLKLQSDPTTIVHPNIESANIPNAAVTTDKVQDSAITMDKIANSAVTSAKIQGLAVSTTKIANNAVTEGKIDSLSISTGKIKNAAVTSAKIADGAITTDKLGNQSVTKNKCNFHVFEEKTFLQLLNECIAALGTSPITYGDFITWYFSENLRIYGCSYDESVSVQRTAVVTIATSRVQISSYDGSDWNNITYLYTDSVNLSDTTLENIKFVL